MRINKKITLTFFVIFFVCSSLIQSQQLSNLNNNDNPIEIFAEEGIEWHKNKNKYVAIGNAKATSGSMTLKSDVIEAFYKEKNSSDMNKAADKLDFYEAARMRDEYIELQKILENKS